MESKLSSKCERSGSTYQNWAAEIVKDFQVLNSECRIATLNALIDACGTPELNYLSEKLEDFLKRDFLRFLPAELCTYLLSYLDDLSLGKCCLVSKTWNEVVSNCQPVWIRCCKAAGWKVDESIKQGLHWKKVYLQALGRTRQLKEGSAFKHKTLVGHTARVYTLKYDGKNYIASGSDDRHIRLWNVTTGECICSIKTHACADLAFSEHFVLTASFDNTISCWRWDTGQLMRSFRGHTGAVFSIAYDEERDLLVSGSADKTVRLWQLSSSDCVNMFHGHKEWVTKVILDRCKVESVHHRPGDHVILSMDKVEVRLWSINHEVNAESLHVFSIANESQQMSLQETSKSNGETTSNFLHPQLIFDGSRILCSSERGIIEWSFVDYKLQRVIPNSNSSSFLIGIGNSILLTADSCNDCLLIRARENQKHGDKNVLQKLNKVKQNLMPTSKCSTQNENQAGDRTCEQISFESIKPSSTADDAVELEINNGDAPPTITNHGVHPQKLDLTHQRLQPMRLLSSPNEYSPNIDSENNVLLLDDNSYLLENNIELVSNNYNLPDILGYYKLPMLRWSKRGTNFVCGNSEWLNGFTYDNNKGLMFAVALPNHSIYMVQWRDWNL